MLAAPEAAVSRAGMLPPAGGGAAWGAGVGWPELGSARRASVGFAPVAHVDLFLESRLRRAAARDGDLGGFCEAKRCCRS